MANYIQVYTEEPRRRIGAEQKELTHVFDFSGANYVMPHAGDTMVDQKGQQWVVQRYHFKSNGMAVLIVEERHEGLIQA